MLSRLPKLRTGTLPLFLVACLYFVTFAVVLPALFRGKIHSEYFRYNERYVDLAMEVFNKNAKRFGEANVKINEILAETDIGISNWVKNNTSRVHNRRATSSRGVDNGLSLAIGVVTLQRSVEKERGVRIGYLTQVMAMLHELASSDRNFREVKLFMCNVDLAGAAYKEATHLSKIFDIYVKYHPGFVNRFDEPWMIFEKEKDDYQFCLEMSRSYKSDYAIILEDDAVPKSDFLQALYQILKHGSYRESKPVIDSLRVQSSWAFMKLYRPEKWSGFGSEAHQWLELGVVGVVGGCVFTVVWMCYQRKFLRRYTGCKYRAIALAVGSLYFVLLAKCVGRPYLLDYVGEAWAWHWVVEGDHCCTQAVLYPALVVDHLILYLSTKECDIDYAIDHVLRDFARERSLMSYLVEPNLVRHIGMFSSLRSYSKRAADFV